MIKRTHVAVVAVMAALLVVVFGPSISMAGGDVRSRLSGTSGGWTQLGATSAAAGSISIPGPAFRIFFNGPGSVPFGYSTVNSFITTAPDDTAPAFGIGAGFFTSYGKLTMADYTDDSATPGSRTVNKNRGKSSFAAAAAAITITNSQVGAASQVICTVETLDTTCTLLRACVPAAGSFTATMNANCTATTKLAWMIVN